MAKQKLLSLALKLEDPSYPLLGPTVKGFHLFGLWQTESKLRRIVYICVHFSTILFACSQLIDTYIVRNDLGKVLNNMSISAVTIVTAVKAFSYFYWQKSWTILMTEISQEELNQLNKRDTSVTEQINAYKKYSRIVTYFYWMLVFSTNLFMMSIPLLKYGSSKLYREKIKLGKEPLPQIVCSWFPFDNMKMPGYMWGVCFHVITSCLGCGVLAVYDANAVAIMCYLKGQMAVLKGKCSNVFAGAYRETAVCTIKECHRHHSVLVKHFKMFEEVLSPIMFFYVLVCSCTICCSVIQFNMTAATISQKIWVIQYSVALVLQLFLFCWHGNEAAIEAKIANQGVYKSDWWKGDKNLRQMAHLLAGKLNVSLKLRAGPFTTISVPAFITIMKGSYSFYTLFSQIQTNK